MAVTATAEMTAAIEVTALVVVVMRTTRLTGKAGHFLLFFLCSVLLSVSTHNSGSIFAISASLLI